MRRISPRVGGVLAGLLVGAFYASQVKSPAGILHAPGSEYTDLLITHWPNAYFFKQSVLRDHAWPLWTPLIFSGMPFAANPLSGIWYPLNWLFLIMPITPAFNLLLLGHLMLGATGAARLVDRLQPDAKRTWVGPLVGGLAWGLAPKTWASLGAGHVGAVYAVGWLPWIVEAAVAQLRTPGRRIHCRLPLFWALQFLADPRIAAYTVLLLVGLVGWHLLTEYRTRWLRIRDTAAAQRPVSDLVSWAVVGVLALGLSAVQWLPMYNLLPYTTRASLTAEDNVVFSLPVSQLTALLWPHRASLHEWMVYMGVGVLWLAILGWFTRSRPVRYAIIVACCLLVVLALGTNGPLYLLLVNVPGIDLLRVPPRVWHLLSLCTAVLAGLGAGELAGSSHELRLQRDNLRRVAVVLIAFAGFLAIGMWALIPEQTARVSALWPLPWLGVAIAVSETALIGRLRLDRAGVAIVLVVAADLLWVDSRLIERMPDAAAFAEDFEVADRLGQVGGRVYTPSFRPSQHVLASTGLCAVNGVDPFQLTEYARFLNAAAGVEHADEYSITLPPLADDADPRTALADYRPNLVWLSILDAKAIVSQFEMDISDGRSGLLGTSGNLNIYVNETALPWPVVYKRVQVVNELSEALAMLNDQGLEEMAVVRDGYPLYGPAGYEPAALRSSAANRLVIEATGPGLLVVSEIAHPGWKAQVDGQRAEIYTADGILRAVYLSAGDHVIEMIYRPPAVFWGLGLSILSLGALVAAYRRSWVPHE